MGPDLLLRRAGTGTKAIRIFAAGSDLRMMDALAEHQASGPGDSAVIAVVDRRRERVSNKRFNLATNRGLQMAVVDGSSTLRADRVNELAASQAPPGARLS